jgi:hypothetical protein
MATVMGSVQGGPFDPMRANDYRYEGFMGFWGEKISGHSQFVFVSDRPTRNSYPAGLTTRLVNLLRRVDLVGVHFTDFIKRRGVPSSLDLPPSDTPGRHADLLIEEIVCLASSSASRLCMIPVQKKTLELLRQHRVADRLERRLGGDRVVVPDDYAVFWSQHGLSNDDVCEQWRSVLGQCGISSL